MKKLFDNFLNKRINSKILLSKLRKLSKYFCFSNSQTKDLNVLIDNINYINNNQTEKEKYENILI